MRARLSLIALGAALALAACSKNADSPQADASTAAAIETGATVPQDEGTAPAATASDEVEATAIPPAFRGRWGLVPKDCTSTLGDAKGLLTISARRLKFYESVASLAAVQARDGNRFEAAYDFSGEGQTWKLTVDLDLQDGGRTLVRTDHGPDAMPGPLRYTRCG